jgi:hypothetical protein
MMLFVEADQNEMEEAPRERYLKSVHGRSEHEGMAAINP